MSKQDKKGLVPELRFPEFKGIGGWEELSLIQLAKFRRGSFPQPYGLSKWFNDENGMPFIQVFDVNNNLQLKPTTKRRISKLAAEQSVFILKGTLVVTLQGSIGRVAITQYDAYVDRTILIFEEFHKPTEKLFFAYIIQNLFELEKERAPGGIIKTITKEVLSDFTVRLPQFPEQQKIADCLSSLDELISAHIQKHEALQSYKKGLMQNLFPAEGETVPALRFSEFAKSERWTRTKLISTADKNVKWSFVGGPFGSNLKSSDYVSDGVRIIQLQNIGDAEFMDDYKIFTSEEKANELLSNNIYPGDIILSKMGDPVGRACLIPNTHSRYVMCSDGIRLVVDEMEHNKYFIFTLINSNWFRGLVEKTATGSTRKRIGLDDLKKLPLIVPRMEEQQKIADCLSSVDNLITAQAQKIEALKVHKKGLMQHLFPTVED
ncbi:MULTISPECIES: restriction endonuclease subunit S [Cysteiniphilum]|uniref:Type I site-specific deoxyribonuclease specificity subunit n=1 Tax=Cysteiniphilum litorale TaxID=2056700 RepID=A0A8J3E8U0_9GAMM|nr:MULTISPECIES: restriction endonuclease subunit S [Cysteiniphilum]GGF96048.1 type I site-specific deoxyribonuclease specificity subunit [Cysteiniphilum litorale]